MYTYGILALLGFIISGILFGKRIKENQFKVALIVASVTLIGTTIVNGIVGLNQPLELVDVKKKALHAQTGHVQISEDSTLVLFPVYMDYERDLYKSGEVDDHWVDIERPSRSWYGDSEGRMARVQVSWLPEGDSIPYTLIQKEKRIIKDHKWATNFGIPNGYRYYTIYLPNDSVHNLLLEQIDKYFNKDEDYKIAQLN